MADGVPDGYGNVRVSFGGSRNVTQGDKDNATITVYFNGKQVEKNGNVFEDRVPTGTRLTITAEAVNGGRIVGKGEETITVRGGNNNVSMQVYTWDNFVVTVGGKAEGYTNFMEAWNAANGKTAVIKMNADATSVAVTLSSGNVTLDLNGYTLTGNGSTSVITISGGTLTLNDSASGGKITGGGGDNGGGVYVNTGAIFTMNAGTISGNTVVDQGGGVYNEGTFTMNGGAISNNTVRDDTGGGVKNIGTFTMYAGTISGNIANAEGGGVDNSSTGTFTMHGGIITGNNVGIGGGVSTCGTFTMSGGTISGNTAVYNEGGGVNVFGGTFNISGNVKITGNTVSGSPNNLYLDQGETITLAGTLNPASRIGVSMATPGNFTSGWPTYKGSAVATTVFTSDEGMSIHDNTDTGEVNMYR